MKGPSQKKGDIALTKAIATFMELGLEPSLPLSESLPYDIIVDTSEGLKRVQVRYTSEKYVPLRRIHSNSTGYVVKLHRSGAYDWLYVYKPDGTEYLIKREFGNKNSILPLESEKIVKPGS